MPIVTALGNQHLLSVHWDEIKELLGMEGFALEERKWTLGELLSFDVTGKQEGVVHIATTAQ